MEVKHFKLDTGEELLCEVVEWHDEEGFEDEIIIRKAAKLVYTKTTTGIPFYSLRPWMVYQENISDVMTLDRNHIVGMATPPDYLIIQWEDAILDMQELHNQRQKETFEKMKSFYEKAKDKPVSELIGDLLDNIKQIYNTLLKSRPPSVKGQFFEKISISSSMGPGIKVNINSIG